MGATPGSERNEALLCTATGKSGNRCRAFKAASSDRCRLHGPQAVEAIAELHQAAREVRVEEAGRLKLDTAEDVQRLLEDTAGKLAAGRITPPAAAAMNAIARSALHAIDLRLTEEATREIARANAGRSAGVRRRQ
jgi:hypothetical protein